MIQIPNPPGPYIGNPKVPAELHELPVTVSRYHIINVSCKLLHTRKKLNDQSPYDAFSSRYGFKLINALGITKIEPNDIILKPNLLK